MSFMALLPQPEDGREIPISPYLFVQRAFRLLFGWLKLVVTCMASKWIKPAPFFLLIFSLRMIARRIIEMSFMNLSEEEAIIGDNVDWNANYTG